MSTENNKARGLFQLADLAKRTHSSSFELGRNSLFQTASNNSKTTFFAGKPSFLPNRQNTPDIAAKSRVGREFNFLNAKSNETIEHDDQRGKRNTITNQVFFKDSRTNERLLEEKPSTIERDSDGFSLPFPKSRQPTLEAPMNDTSMDLDASNIIDATGPETFHDENVVDDSVAKSQNVEIKPASSNRGWQAFKNFGLASPRTPTRSSFKSTNEETRPRTPLKHVSPLADDLGETYRPSTSRPSEDEPSKSLTQRPNTTMAKFGNLTTPHVSTTQQQADPSNNELEEIAAEIDLTSLAFHEEIENSRKILLSKLAELTQLEKQLLEQSDLLQSQTAETLALHVDLMCCVTPLFIDEVNKLARARSIDH